MKLNGWQRLWIVLSAPFVIGAAIGAILSVVHGEFGFLWFSIAAGIVWPALMYAFGWTIVWVRRGFRGE